MNIIAVCIILFGVVPTVYSGGVRVKGPLGGNGSVQCSYRAGYERKPKVFKKGKPETELVRLEQSVLWTRDSRFSVEDDAQNRVFTVTIRNLSVSDAGRYWCEVGTWLWNVRTEVNLDVVKDEERDEEFDPTTENGFVFQLTVSADGTSQRTIEPQNQQTNMRDKSVQLGVALTVVLLLCGISSVIFILTKTTKAKRVCTQSGKNTDFDLSPDSVIYATPTLQRNWTRSPPSHRQPPVMLGCSEEPRRQGPDAVVYSVLPRYGNASHRDSQEQFSTSTQPELLHYSELYFEQRSHVPSDTSALSDVYVTVQPH